MQIHVQYVVNVRDYDEGMKGQKRSWTHLKGIPRGDQFEGLTEPWQNDQCTTFGHAG